MADKLQRCALAFQRLIDTQYEIIIGRKGQMSKIILNFSETEFVHLAGLHKLVDNEWSESFVKLEDAEIEVNDISDSFSEIDGFVQTSIEKLHDMFYLRSKDVPEKLLFRPEIIMYERLIATHCLCYLGSGCAVESFFKEKAFCHPKYSFLNILIPFHGLFR